jgi:hypothetical protein
MKTLISTFVTLLVLLPFSTLSQPRPDRFTLGQYNFEIDLPSRPTDVEATHFKLLNYDVYGELIEWDQAKRFAAIGIYRPYKANWALTGPEKAILLAEYTKTVLADFREQKLVASESPFSFSGSKGIEIRGMGDVRTVARLFFVGNRLFEIIVSSGETPGFDPQTTILNSFRLLTKTETVAALKRENDLPEVSQRPAAVRLGNDLQDSGLKGNVCSVIAESVTPPGTAREMDRESYYGPSGNLMREITYSRGYPQEITQWGWIDGKRISSTRIVFYEPQEAFAKGPPVPLGPTSGMMGNSRRNAAFGMRHEYKYDNLGRITEQQAFNSEGKLRWTKKFTNSSTGREIQTLDETGGFLTRTFETFDKNGNVVEYKVLDMSGKPVWTNRYTYEFDQAGNWIVGKIFLGGAVRPKPIKPKSTIFRTITYCDETAL